MNWKIFNHIVVPMMLLLLPTYVYALAWLGTIEMRYTITPEHNPPTLTPANIEVDLPTLYNPTMDVYYVQIDYSDPQNPVAALEVYEKCYIYVVLTTSNDINLPKIDILVKLENDNTTYELWVAMDTPYSNYCLVAAGTYSVSVRCYGEFAVSEASGTIILELEYEF